ncbi:uncharacterized protein SRS1_13736 [Sporisorium reilianum f. sp. reilianum]|uniref:RanBD1 domain-containing protein n=1 Tax=Sporisorium reilianum f. sp. reilianum TaxID=72559 RepID=A0A2N8UDS8_9BASI|nr:uncharacterized protein SRS1_13736 [Sporisorium reilianum f. sp. reilianum]
MGPSRHTRAAAAASAGASASRNDESTSASPSKTPVRPSPYARTPTKPPSSSALALGPSTPTSRTSSPMMLREIFSMISPFRGLSRARRSAAFGAADEADADQDMPTEAHLGQPSKLGKVQEAVDADDADDADDRMIEDAEEGLSVADVPTPTQKAPSSQLAPRSPSPRPRPPLAAPPKSLPLADSSLVTPGLRRQFANAPSTPGPSTSYAPPSQTSPVSRNYDLLARFFSEKQRGGQGGLTEVEVEGCIRLIEESMASGRNLESEFASGGSNYGRPSVQTSGFAPSSRASSIAPPALPSSQSINTLFHPGTNRLPASSSAYSFLAPRAPASRSALGAAPSTTRRRPIYLGPGMSGLSLNRRRPVVASASRAATLAKTAPQSFMPRSSTDPDLAGLARHADDTHELMDRAEEAKRRRTAADAVNATPSTPARGSRSEQTVQFEPAYEKEARQSSLLAKDIAASSSSTNGVSGSPLKRAAPSAGVPAVKTSPPKPTTRTASAIQDILKTTPPVRPPTKPELVNPYQAAAPLPAKSKSSAEGDDANTTPVRRSARTSMLTRAKARETARAAEKSSPPKESVLDLIERTAPKTISKRKAATETPEPQQNGKTSAPEPAVSASMEERKLQKTEEVQRRLEALNKSKSQPKEQQQEQPQQSASKPAVADTKSAKVSANLVPPQYTATKPKKPSPLSAAFQAPDSPSSDSETAAPVPARGPAISQPSFSFGSPAAANAAKPATPSSGFSFSVPKPASSSAPVTSSAPAAAPSSGFSFSKPAASTAEPAKAATTAAPAAMLSFSFSPVAAAPAQQKPVATSTPASTGFSFSAPTTSTLSASNSTSTAASSQSSSARSQVLAEDASTLPKFDWQIEPVPASERANQALRDEIKSVAQAALPKFDFVYDIETSSDGYEKGAAAKAATPVAGFGFSAPAQPASTPASSTAAPAAATSSDSTATEDTSADDASKPQSSGLLGEGEGEESECTLHEVRAKIWRLDIESKSWKDLGVCIAKIKHDSATGKHRLLARNEANGKVAVNFMTYKGLKSTLDKTVNSFLGFDGKEPAQYRMKVKTEDAASEFKQTLEGVAAKA